MSKSFAWRCHRSDTLHFSSFWLGRYWQVTFMYTIWADKLYLFLYYINKVNSLSVCSYVMGIFRILSVSLSPFVSLCLCLCMCISLPLSIPPPSLLLFMKNIIQGHIGKKVFMYPYVSFKGHPNPLTYNKYTLVSRSISLPSPPVLYCGVCRIRLMVS